MNRIVRINEEGLKSGICDLMDEVIKGIGREEFEVYYQPKFNIRGEVPVLSSAEALVRWNHPEKGIVFPDRFIPQLEENGLITKLDRYVWKKAAMQIRDWKKRLKISVPVSVNVSRKDLSDPDLIGCLKGILEDTGLSAEELLLEITESAYGEDPEHLIRTVTDLRSLGFLIEMDDFGTGYSSLNMISRIPVDALKIDMRFVKDAFEGKGDTRMIGIIIDIAGYLGVLSVAEGVEDEKQLQILKQMGVDVVQGYHFSKPVKAEEFERFLEEKIRYLCKENR